MASLSLKERLESLKAKVKQPAGQQQQPPTSSQKSADVANTITNNSANSQQSQQQQSSCNDNSERVVVPLSKDGPDVPSGVPAAVQQQHQHQQDNNDVEVDPNYYCHQHPSDVGPAAGAIMVKPAWIRHRGIIPQTNRQPSRTPEGERPSTFTIMDRVLFHQQQQQQKQQQQQPAVAGSRRARDDHGDEDYMQEQQQNSIDLLPGQLPIEREMRDIAELYELGDSISEGVFGVVYRGCCKATNETFALKKIKENWFTESKEGFPHYLLRELDLVLRLKDDRLMEGIELVSNKPTRQVFGIGAADSVVVEKPTSVRSPLLGELCSSFVPVHPVTRPSIYLVSEFGGRTLRHEILRERRPLNIAAVKFLLKQLLEGVATMARNNILHRDLKPSNILVDPASGKAKICDFGLARIVQHSSKRRNLSSNVVTLYYRAPELHFGVRDYHAAVDVWSLGCIFAEMLIGDPLFMANEEPAHLCEICRIVGLPNDVNFPGFLNLPDAAYALRNVEVERANEFESERQRQRQQHQQPSRDNNDDDDVGYVKSNRLESHIKAMRARLWRMAEAQDPLLAKEQVATSREHELTAEGMHLLDMMLQWSPKVRITAAEALEHPFFKQAPEASAEDVLVRRKTSHDKLRAERR